MPAVKKEGPASAILLSADEIRSFLALLQIDVHQPIDVSQLKEKIRMIFSRDREKMPSPIEWKGQWKEKIEEWKGQWKEKSILQSKVNKFWSILSIWDGKIHTSHVDSVEAIMMLMHDCIRMAEDEPIKLSSHVWLFKGFRYAVDGLYSDEQFRLLILEEFDKERRRFERLKQKYDSAEQESTRSRIRIPENIRIEVWRRDGGTCVRCGSRENLEYDHIIPLSRGGSNTARNIELLCERCNRSKGANIG